MNIKHFLLIVSTLLVFSCKKQNVLQLGTDYNQDQNEFQRIAKQINKGDGIKVFLDTKHIVNFGIIGGDNEVEIAACGYSHQSLNNNVEIDNYNKFLVRDQNGEFKRYSFYDTSDKNRKFSIDEGRMVLSSFMLQLPVGNKVLENVILADCELNGQPIDTYRFTDDGVYRPEWVNASSRIVQDVEPAKEVPSVDTNDYKQIETEFATIAKQINDASPYSIHLNRKVIYSYETKVGKTAIAYLFDFQPFDGKQEINYNKYLVRHETGDFKRYMIVDSQTANRSFTKDDGSEILSNFINDSYIGNCNKGNVIVVESDIFGENVLGHGFGKEGGTLRNWGPVNIVQKIEMDKK